MTDEKLTKRDYWKMKNEDLMDVLDKRKIPYDPENLNRKDLIEQLLTEDALSGDLDRPVQFNDDGEPGEVEVVREFIDVVFHNQAGEPKYVFLGYNGKFLYLPRECLCRIPAEFLNVLKSAVSEKMVQYEKGGKMSYRHVRVPRISYEILDRGVINK